MPLWRTSASRKQFDLFICQSISICSLPHPFNCQTINLLIHLATCPYVYPPTPIFTLSIIYPSIFSFIYPSTQFPIHLLSIHPSIFSFIHPSTHLFIHSLSRYLFIYTATNLSAHPLFTEDVLCVRHHTCVRKAKHAMVVGHPSSSHSRPPVVQGKWVGQTLSHHHPEEKKDLKTEPRKDVNMTL